MEKEKINNLINNIFLSLIVISGFYLLFPEKIKQFYNSIENTKNKVNEIILHSGKQIENPKKNNTYSINDNNFNESGKNFINFGKLNIKNNKIFLYFYINLKENEQLLGKIELYKNQINIEIDNTKGFTPDKTYILENTYENLLRIFLNKIKNINPNFIKNYQNHHNKLLKIYKNFLTITW